MARNEKQRLIVSRPKPSPPNLKTLKARTCLLYQDHHFLLYLSAHYKTTTRAQMAVRRISLDRSDENIIQPFDKQVDVKQILDSDSSSLSLTMSTEDTVEREQLSHQSRPASQGNDLPLPNNDELSEETIITASFHIWTERHIHLPKVFDKTGRLRPQYRHLKVKLSAATEQRMRQVAADKQLQLQQIHSLLESPVGFPAGFNISVSQAASEDPQRVTTKKSQIPSQTGDPNLSSPHQPSDVLDRSPSHSRFNKKVDFDGSTPQVNNSLPTKATFSTQTKKRCSNPSTYHRSKNTLSCPRKAQKVAGQQNPGKSLQSGPAPNLAEQEAFQSLPKPNITPDQSNAHRIQAYPKVLYSLSRTSSLASPEGLSRLQCPERIIDHPLGAKRQIAYQPQPTRTEPMLPSPSAREQAIAARVLHERIQQQQSRNSETCNNCRKNSCSCNATQQPIEKILCSDNDCFRKWWGVDDLQKCCGIKLSDARETKQNFKCWFCPECSKKAQVLLNAVPTRAPLSPSRDPRTIVPNASGHPGPEDCAWPEDAEIREPLQALTGILQQYTGTTTMARNHSSQINPHTSILDIPCIRGETLQSAGTAHNVICILRRLLDVPDAVLIRDKVTEAKLQHISCSVCLRGILSYLITDFIFYAGSPFEDTSLWSKVLTDCKQPNDLNPFGPC